VIVDPIGAYVRSATRPVFHKGNSSKKEKRSKKENGLWKMPQLWKSATQSVAFGAIFLMRIPTAAWKSLACALGFSHIYHRPRRRLINMEQNFILKTIRGVRVCVLESYAPPALYILAYGYPGLTAGACILNKNIETVTMSSDRSLVDRRG
jgi:hypothetical protein